MPDIQVQGTEEDRKTFTDCFRHYTTAREDLDVRIADFDKKDILFRSHIDKANWPYRSLVFDPRIFTILYEKTARTFANKPRGRMQPREGGDALGAKINNELLSFQWDDNERVDGMAMLAKWAMMDLNARKYGASFGLSSWHWQKCTKRGAKGEYKSEIFFDGPNFKPWANRDVLHNPSYSTIKNWIQLRSYPTLQELQDTNDAARSKAIYKNLDLLKASVKKDVKGGGDRRDSNYTAKNLTIKGLTDYLGSDMLFKTIEIVTEYRNDRWITFAPKHGVIIRDIPNPYDHGQIPVVQLKYYPVDDDIYGLSEIEPLERLQRAINAYVNQNLDTLNLNTYVPLKVRNTQGAVQMHTLEFGPGKKWLMNDPTTDVVAHNQGNAGVSEFTNVYRIMVGALQEAAGETSAMTSTAVPGEGNKTATEIKDTSISRSARDNFNQLFLTEAMKKQMMFWFKMNQQFLFSGTEQQKIIQVVGKDAIKYFQDMGLDGEGLTEEGIETLSDPTLSDTVQPTDLQQPMYPVQVGGETIPKFQMEAGAQTGSLVVEPNDLSGMYDYIPDVGSMNSIANEQELKAKQNFLSQVSGIDPTTGQPSGVGQLMMQEGKKIKITDLVVDVAEDTGFKNADQYIENIPQPAEMGGQIDPETGQPIQGGEGFAQTGQAGMGNGGVQGMAASGQAAS